MNDIQLMPANLASMGVPRKVGPPEADIITIWHTPYPVLTNYTRLCRDLGIKPFAGGTYQNQGPNWKIGYITSGYRVIIGADESPHKYGLAIDFVVPNLKKQFEIVLKAQKYFTRSGIYPDKQIVHVDLVPQIWINKFNAARHWVCLDVRSKDKYYNFMDIDRTISFAKKKRMVA